MTTADERLAVLMAVFTSGGWNDLSGRLDDPAAVSVAARDAELRAGPREARLAALRAAFPASSPRLARERAVLAGAGAGAALALTLRAAAGLGGAPPPGPPLLLRLLHQQLS